MKYVYETLPQNYEDYASGRVIYHTRGTTAFPVRLASEMIQRCFAFLRDKGKRGPYTLYDPCCGSAYLLTVIGLLHGEHIKRILASDINADVLTVAKHNLALLTPEGLATRKAQIERDIAQYHKSSHYEALESIARLSKMLTRSAIQDMHVFQQDITKPSPHDVGEVAKQAAPIDVIITDLPYGDLTSWQGAQDAPLNHFFNHIYPIVSQTDSVVAIAADKSQKLQHEQFRRLQYFKIGKRHVAIFEPVPGRDP